MCTGNVYCDQISAEAVSSIAAKLNIIPELIEESAFIFEHEVNWHEIVATQNENPSHPQTIYRQLLSSKQLWINESHHAISAEEYDLGQRFSRR